MPDPPTRAKASRRTNTIHALPGLQPAYLDDHPAGPISLKGIVAFTATGRRPSSSRTRQLQPNTNGEGMLSQ